MSIVDGTDILRGEVLLFNPMRIVSACTWFRRKHCERAIQTFAVHEGVLIAQSKTPAIS